MTEDQRKSTTTEDQRVVVTEVPNSLKQLLRLIIFNFYTVQDIPIIDMLVRNPCIKEEDMCELLKYDRKLLRSRIAVLKNDKFIQIKLRMETGPDGKAQKFNYYYINYGAFVNMIKYKFDFMRKKMESMERNVTSRASFLCPKCCSTFTDLEADQLFDFSSGEFRCVYCNNVVEEDSSSLPKQDTRLMMARFNSQLEPLYKLLREVEEIRLAPELMEPEPTDLSTLLGLNKTSATNATGEVWSGEATRHKQSEETRIDVQVEEQGADTKQVVKERPTWLTESTVIDRELARTSMMLEEEGLKTAAQPSEQVTASTSKNSMDIMSVLLQHEKHSTSNPQANINAAVSSIKQQADDSGSDSSYGEPDDIGIPNFYNNLSSGVKESDDEDEVPMITVGNKRIAITDVDDKIIQEMTREEKDCYIQVYQEFYAPMYE